MILWKLELLAIDELKILEVNLVGEVLGQPEVIFVEADRGLILCKVWMYI
jgi:hypothetical protein